MIFLPDSSHEVSNWAELLEFRAQSKTDEILYTFLAEGSPSLAEGNPSPSQLSYAELQNRARQIAAHLQTQTSPGDKTILLLPPGLDLIAAFFGCLLAGIAAIPLPAPHPARLETQKERLLSIANDARPTAILSNQEIRNSLAPIHAEIATATENGARWIEMETIPDSPDYQPPALNENTIAFLQYTSGSTSSPKGVVVSHGNLLHNSQIIYRAFGHSAQSKGVIWLPPYHDMGLIGGILQPLFGGFPVSLFSPASFLMRPLRWLQTISDTRATTSGGPNFALDLCAKKITEAQKETLDLSSWQVAFVGAEPVRVETLDRFSDAFAPCGFKREAFLPCYGLAEATLFVSGFKRNSHPTILHQQHRALVGCGLVADELDVRIMPQAGSTPEAAAPAWSTPDGEIGEVCVAGKSVAQGYWNQPAETREIFGAQRDGKTFLRTGDLGFFQDGELFLTGRSKDLIIIGGRNHMAEDIEGTIKSASEKIGECAAFSIDFEGAEQLVIAAEIERLARVELEAQNEIIAAIRQSIAARHDLRAREIYLVREGKLPRTPSGKIQRHRCAEFVEGE